MLRSASAPAGKRRSTLAAALIALGVAASAALTASAAEAPAILSTPPQAPVAPPPPEAWAVALAEEDAQRAALALPEATEDRNQALAEAAGRLLVVGFHGTEPTHRDVRALIGQIRAGHVGGVILMGRNIRSRAQVRRLVAALKDVAPGGKLAVLIDQEGGAVTRANAGNGFHNIPSAKRVARLGDAKAASVFQDIAATLADIGVAANLAPVVDLALEPRSGVIARAGRSYGSDPETVAHLAGRFVEAHRAAGIGACLKHFPGHGSVKGDTHKGFVSTAGRWRPDLELAPYRRLAAWDSPVRAGCVMTSHLYVPELAGPEDAIVTFSRRALDMLRWEIGFDGVAITDDLAMGAVAAAKPFDDAAVSAIAAGHDMALITDWRMDGPDAPARFEAALAQALAEGRIAPWRIEEALWRVDRWLTTAR